MTSGVPGPVTDTEKFTPARAELLTAPLPLPDCFELTVTSVRRPMTAEGLTTNTLPFPLEVLIPATAMPAPCRDGARQVLLPLAWMAQLDTHENPPLTLPPESRVHPIGLSPFPVVE